MKNQNATPEPTAPKQPDAHSRSHPSAGSQYGTFEQVNGAVVNDLIQELKNAKFALEGLHLWAGSIADMVPKVGKERSDYKGFRMAMKDAEIVLGVNTENNEPQSMTGLDQHE